MKKSLLMMRLGWGIIFFVFAVNSFGRMVVEVLYGNNDLALGAFLLFMIEATVSYALLKIELGGVALDYTDFARELKIYSKAWEYQTPEERDVSFLSIQAKYFALERNDSVKFKGKTIPKYRLEQKEELRGRMLELYRRTS